MRHEPAPFGNGLLQSAVPKAPIEQEARRAYGLNLRGVVTHLYTRNNAPAGGRVVATTYAAIATYGSRRLFLPRVQVSQPLGSLHTGQVGGLRETQIAISGVLDLEHTDPASMDGSHVVVSHFDDDLSQPYISAILEHPLADGGGPINGPIENRVRLSNTDGRPLLVHWNGATWGLDGAGDWILDLRRAYDGALGDKGVEPAPATDGSRGNYRVRLPRGAQIVVEIDGSPALVVDHSGANARLIVGDGSHSVAIAEHMQVLYEALTQWAYTQLFLLSPLGPTTPAIAAGAPPPPSWDAAIASTKVKLPDT